MRTLQRRFALVRHYVLAVSSLVLTMTFGSMAAHASLVSYHVVANPVGGSGNTVFDLTFFLDDTSFPMTGTATVTFSSVDAILTGPFSTLAPIPFTFANTNTSIQNFFGAVQMVPFNAPINSSGMITGLITGVQPGGGPCVARTAFSNNVPLGQVVDALFVASGQPPSCTKGNTVRDVAQIVNGSISGPTAVSAVPLPAALPLFLSALAGLGLMGWRRRRREAVA